MAYSGFVPPGVVLPFAGATAPQGWVLCDGAPLSRTTYAALFAAIGTTFGAPDGSSFNLPDMRGVYARGAGTNGTGNYGGVTGHTPAGGSLGNKGGQKTAKNGLANASSPVSVSGSTGSTASDLYVSNVNKLNQAYSTFAAGGYTSGDSSYNANTHIHSFSGSGTANAQVITGDSETTPAFLAMNYIIKI